MTTTTARLYAVPDPTPREPMPWILRLKEIARRAYDLAMSVPRGAVGWAVSTLTRWGRTLAAAMPGLTSALARAGRAASTVGILPITAAALAGDVAHEVPEFGGQPIERLADHGLEPVGINLHHGDHCPAAPLALRTRGRFAISTSQGPSQPGRLRRLAAEGATSTRGRRPT